MRAREIDIMKKKRKGDEWRDEEKGRYEESQIKKDSERGNKRNRDGGRKRESGRDMGKD